MPNAQCLLILTELREQAGLSLSEMARRFGLEGTQSRKTVGAWEHGEMTPRKRWRGAFMRYLWDDLGLRRQPKQFAQVWDTLVEEWGWEPITDAEWHAFTTVYRQGNDADRASALILPGRARAAVDTPLQLPSPIVRVPAPAAPGGRRVVKGTSCARRLEQDALARFTAPTIRCSTARSLSRPCCLSTPAIPISFGVLKPKPSASPGSTIRRSSRSTISGASPMAHAW